MPDTAATHHLMLADPWAAWLAQAPTAETVYKAMTTVTIETLQAWLTEYGVSTPDSWPVHAQDLWGVDEVHIAQTALHRNSLTGDLLFDQLVGSLNSMKTA